jgi:acetyl-CoA carboxylase biotin carboxylase subunit
MVVNGMTEVKKDPIRKLLVANRGEIAVRVMRGAKDLGIRTAVVFSEADRRGLPVLLADEAYCVGPAPSAESYLQGESIAHLARDIGADAVHPGYGFLAENADFAAQCEQVGVRFIGPSVSAIAAMGSKLESRKLMTAAGVPVVPGGDRPLANLEEATAAAEDVGYPVMLKASAGGGGKGMRLVRGSEDLSAAYRAARSEAGSSFGDDQVYVEKYIERPRHIEVQIIGDHYGRIVALGERECSIQRRHQKVVEESPSPIVDAELRAEICEAAVRAAATVSYTNAGTVEFLFDRDGRYYFLEMNTRLQVEHPVTEMVTGLDLVKAQLEVAQGMPLGEEFDQVRPNGHAIEVRLYAEDPYRGFTPSPGRIEFLRLPAGPGVRNDCGVYEGSEVSIHYDPMLGKLIVWGRDREQALNRLARALEELRLEGVQTTVPLYRALTRDEDFRAGRMDIEMLDRKLAANELRVGPDDGDDSIVIAVALDYLESRSRAAAVSLDNDGRRDHWRDAARRDGMRGT